MGMLLLFSCSALSNSLRPHGLQHTRLPCPSPSPGACSNLFPLSWWCHWTVTSSLLAPSPAFNLSQHQVSSPVSQLFTSGSQSIEVSASASVLPKNIQDWLPLGLTGLILLCKECSESSPVPQFKSISSSVLAFFMVQLSHWNMTTGKTIGLTIWTFVSKVISLLLNMLSRFLIDLDLS